VGCASSAATARPATFGSSLVRDLAFRVPYVIPTYEIVDGLFALGERKQTLHDRMASTYVVRTPSYRRAGPLVVASVVALAGWIRGGGVQHDARRGLHGVNDDAAGRAAMGQVLDIDPGPC